MENLTLPGVECIEHFFRAVNYAKKKIKYGNEAPSAAAAASGIFSTTNGVVEDRIVVHKWDGMIGLEALWSIAKPKPNSNPKP